MENLLLPEVNYQSQLELTKQELEDSILYASKLQAAILPNPEVFQTLFEDAFVFFQPKDLVGGDFYWVCAYENQVYFAVGDCTGHGIPGALVSMAGNSILRQIIRIKGLDDPAEIIKLLDEEITGLFNENLTSGHTRDGMDIAFCRFDLTEQVGYFCGAGRPLLCVNNGDIIEYAGDRSSVGFLDLNIKTFNTRTFALNKGDYYYLFSDGYTDQFGGEKIKKFNRKRFRTLLQSLNELPMIKQKKELELAFRNWKGKNTQLDDVCVVGVKV